jgi:hypothetical protein
MKHAVGILPTAVGSVFLAALAFAGEPYGAGRTSGTSFTGFVGQHMVSGTVQSIDKGTGKVSIDANGRMMDLHFPEAAINDLNKGDQVTLQLAIRKSGSSASSGMGAGTHDMSGPETSGARPHSGSQH